LNPTLDDEAKAANGSDDGADSSSASDDNGGYYDTADAFIDDSEFTRLRKTVKHAEYGQFFVHSASDAIDALISSSESEPDVYDSLLFSDF
jgi:hypothetical protein